MPTTTTNQEERTTELSSYNTTTNQEERTTELSSYKGSWIGNQWIPPPGWRLYSAKEIRSMLQEHSILFIGDSLCRRFMASMYEVVNATDLDDIPQFTLDSAKIIDVNRRTEKGEFNERCERYEKHPVFGRDPQYHKIKNDTSDLYCDICRPMPPGGSETTHDRYWDFVKAPCYNQIRSLIEQDYATQHSVTRHYSLIVIAMGEWEAYKKDNRKYCLPNGKRKFFPEAAYEELETTLQQLPRLVNKEIPSYQNHDRAVIWRMNGYSQYSFNHDIYSHMYDQIRQHFQQHSSRQQNIHLLDWAQAIEARSHENQRIMGDLPSHYGTDARIQLIQMFINLLVERDLVTPPA